MIAGVLRDLFHQKVSDGQISRLQSIGRKALQSGYYNIVVCDRYSAYNQLADDGRQFCCAPLL